MGRKGMSKHIKREVSPVFWPIHRKTDVWAVHPSPGPHSAYRAIPLLVVVRDILKYASNSREAEIILKQGKVKVDGKVRRDSGFPIGLMDVLEIPATKEFFRVLPNNKGLGLHRIKGDETEIKLVRIESRKTVNGGHVQLNLHDGGNIVIGVTDATRQHETEFGTYDVLKVHLRDKGIEQVLRLDEGASALITSGASSGQVGRIQAINKRAGFPDTVTLVTAGNEEIRTVIDYVFPVGTEEPIISVPRGD